MPIHLRNAEKSMILTQLKKIFTSKITKNVSKLVLVGNFLCKFGNVGKVVAKSNFHHCREHTLSYNIHKNHNPSIFHLFYFKFQIYAIFVYELLVRQRGLSVCSHKYG